MSTLCNLCRTDHSRLVGLIEVIVHDLTETDILRLKRALERRFEQQLRDEITNR